MSSFGSLKRGSSVPAGRRLAQQRDKTAVTATAQNKGAKLATKGCKGNELLLQTSSNDNVTEDEPIPSRQPSNSPKSSLFTIASLLGSAARRRKGSQCVDARAGISSGEAMQTVLTSEQKKDASSNDDTSIGCVQLSAFYGGQGLTCENQFKGSMPGYDGNGPNPNVVTGEGRSKGPRGGSADATGAYNQVIGSKRKCGGSHSLSSSATQSGHVTKKPRPLSILRGGRQRQTFAKSKRCRGIEEVLNKQLLHSQSLEDEEQWKGDGFDKVGSSISEQSVKGEGNSVARCVEECKSSEREVLTQSSSLPRGTSSNISTVADSDNASQPVSNSIKLLSPLPSNPEADEQQSSHLADCITSEARRRACHQNYNKPADTGLSLPVGPQHTGRGSGTNIPTLPMSSAAPTCAPPSSATPSLATPISATPSTALSSTVPSATHTSATPSTTPQVKISPPKQNISRPRVVSPLVTHSLRLTVTPTRPAHNTKEDKSPNPEGTEPNKETAECSTESLIPPPNAPLPVTSYHSPFMYPALTHPWSPTMEWQYPSILSMILTPSPSQQMKRQSESMPSDSTYSEHPSKWMWADPFAGMSGINGGAPALPSNLFSPQQLFSQPMSPFSPSQLLNLSMPKVDSFQAIVSPSMVPPSGNGGGAEVGSLEENPFKGMQSSGVEEEQKVASGVHLSGAGGEAEGTRAPKRRRKGSSKADKAHGESSLPQHSYSSHTPSKDTTQENTEHHAPLNTYDSQYPPHVFSPRLTHIPPAPVLLPNMPTGCPASNNLDPAHFCYPPANQMPLSPPPSWQMLLTQMNGLLQLQNIHKNMEEHRQHLPVQSCDAPMATPTDNQDHPSRVYPMLHHSNVPAMGYSRAGFEGAFQSGCGQYKCGPVTTGNSHFSHLSDPTSHHASCKDGYCHHIEEQLRKAKKQRKRKKSSALAKDEYGELKGTVASCRRGLRQVIQDAVKNASTANTAKTSHSTWLSSPSKLRHHMVEQAQSFLQRYQRVITHQHTF